jgi:hypothetical protein
MKQTMKNATHIEGVLYQHALQLKTSGENSKNPGTQFISGTIDIATDDALTNIVSIHYTYVTAKTSKGNDDARFTTLMNIINGTIGNVMEHGVDKAAKLRVDSAIGLNEFFSTRTGAEELVSVKRNEGGFIHVVQTLAADENTRSTFECDMVIYKVSRIDADEEKSRPEQVRVSGFIFDFRKALLPVEFVVYNPKAMQYFEDLDASKSNPCFTKVSGRQISTTVMVKSVEEGAFGEQKVTETPRTNRDFVITWAQAEPYTWDDESTITSQEFKAALGDREVAVAAIKQRQDDYNASKAQTQAPVAAASAPSGFNF